MHETTIFFPGGVRLTTWLALAAFIVLAGRKWSWRPIVAAWVWLAAFEAVFQTTKFATGKPFPHFEAPGAVAYIILGVITVVWFTPQGVRPDTRLLAITAVIWVAWILVGFPINEKTLVGFDPGAEVLNAAAKTLLALAYLVPLLRVRDRVELAQQEPDQSVRLPCKRLHLSHSLRLGRGLNG